VGVLNIHDIMFAHNVPAYTAARKRRALKVTSQVAISGAESAVCDCFVLFCHNACNSATAPKSENKFRNACSYQGSAYLFKTLQRSSLKAAYMPTKLTIRILTSCCTVAYICLQFVRLDFEVYTTSSFN